MRFVVQFSHKKYLEIARKLHDGDETYEIPLGVYRQLAVVVEAADAAEAVRVAEDELGWPHHESNLVPFGVASQDEIVAQYRAGGAPDFERIEELTGA